MVTRGAVVSERMPGGFAAVYKVLSAFEETGRCRRGYFVERPGRRPVRHRRGGRPAAHLHRASATGRSKPEAVALAATDPANPYGAALPWPERDEAARPGHRPGRKAGALVVLVDGALALYVERGGRTLLTWTDDADLLGPGGRALADAVRRGALGRLTVERADGEQLLGGGATPLRAGARRRRLRGHPRGLRLQVCVPEGDTVWRAARHLDQALSGPGARCAPTSGCPALATADLAGGTVAETVSRGKHLLTRIDRDDALDPAHPPEDGGLLARLPPGPALATARPHGPGRARTGDEDGGRLPARRRRAGRPGSNWWLSSTDSSSMLEAQDFRRPPDSQGRQCAGRGDRFRDRREASRSRRSGAQPLRGGAPDKPHPHGTGMAGAIASHKADGRRAGCAPPRHPRLRRCAAAEAPRQIRRGSTGRSARAPASSNELRRSEGPPLDRAFKTAFDKSVVLIAAAGNAGPKSPPLYPGADPNVIAVSATDEDNKVYTGANRGKYVAVAAPGVDILVPAPDGNYQFTTGTSVAAAQVSGVVALMLQRNPKLTPPTCAAF